MFFVYQLSIICLILDLIYWMVTIFIFDANHQYSDPFGSCYHTNETVEQWIQVVEFQTNSINRGKHPKIRTSSTTSRKTCQAWRLAMHSVNAKPHGSYRRWRFKSFRSVVTTPAKQVLVNWRRYDFTDFLERKKLYYERTWPWQKKWCCITMQVAYCDSVTSCEKRCYISRPSTLNAL